MARKVNLMWETKEQYKKLWDEVWAFFQDDIDKLIKVKQLPAEFMNVTFHHKSGKFAILLKVATQAGHVKVCYITTPSIFSRDPDLYDVLDREANIQMERLNDINLVKARLLFTIFSIVKALMKDPLLTPVKVYDVVDSKDWVVVTQVDTGETKWTTIDTLPMF